VAALRAGVFVLARSSLGRLPDSLYPLMLTRVGDAQVPDLSRLLTTRIRPHRDDCHCPLRVRPPRPWLPRTDALPHRCLIVLISIVQLGTCRPEDGALPDTRPKPFQQSKSHCLQPIESPAESELLRSAHLLHGRYASMCRQDKKHNANKFFICICRGTRVAFQRVACTVPAPHSPAPLRQLVLG